MKMNWYRFLGVLIVAISVINGVWAQSDGAKLVALLTICVGSWLISEESDDA